MKGITTVLVIKTYGLWGLHVSLMGKALDTGSKFLKTALETGKRRLTSSLPSFQALNINTLICEGRTETEAEQSGETKRNE